MVFSTLWAGIPVRMRLRVTMAGIPAVAEEIVGLLSKERVALLTAMDALDAPDALTRRVSLIRVYINQHLGGIPEERALEQELEAMIGMEAGTTSKAPEVVQTVVIPTVSTTAHAVPTSPIPGPVAQAQVVKTPEDRAREAHENALVEADADTPVRKPERIVPRPIVAEKRNGVSLEAHQRLREAHVIMTVAALDGLLRENRCFITGKRFKEGDKITLVGHKLLASYELVRKYGRDNGWSWTPIPLAKDCLADWGLFATAVLEEKSPEQRVVMLRTRLEAEDVRCKDGSVSGNDLTSAYFWCHLLKVAIRMEENGMERTAAEQKRDSEFAKQKLLAATREEDRKARLVEMDAQKKKALETAQENFKTRDAIRARHVAIRARHVAIKEELANLETSVMDATKKDEQCSALKTERATLGIEFEALCELWKDLQGDEQDTPARNYRVEDSARPNKGKKPPLQLAPEEMNRRAEEKKLERVRRAEEANRKRDRKDFGEISHTTTAAPASKKKGQEEDKKAKKQKR